ncbi:MAG: hypothetical protein M0Z87_08545 [Actinomycetota bacterium]|nr:hypothetical protein [Actinomycetota bacterium]
MWGLQHDANPGQELVAETEAFLDGSMETLLERQGRLVPDWAYVNRLAHSDLEGVRRLASAKAVGRGSRVSWISAMSAVADFLKNAAGDKPDILRSVQTRCLVPYELELIARGYGAQAKSPDGVRTELIRLLRDHLRN